MRPNRSAEKQTSDTMNRRDFLNSSARTGLTAGIAAGVFAHSQQTAVASSPGERVVLGVIGLGGRGENLVKGFLERDDIGISYLCDPDPSQHPRLSDEVQKRTGHAPKRVTDYRRVLEDASVDAIVIAAPDHWHCPLAVFGCMAGKDVYVEKPLSYSIWEGRKAVEAARKYKRVVQVGTQSRSAPYVKNALEYINEGKLGDIPLTRVCNLKSGQAFHEPKNSAPPAGIDYDLWLGPAPKHPFNLGRFHKSWHYYWDYSGGDMANDGVHQLDLARWLIGKDWPRSVTSSGGNFAFDHDDNETPDTQTVTIDFGDSQLIYEQIGFGNYMLKEDPSLRNGDFFPLWTQYSTRIEFYGTKGLMMLGRHGGGWQVFTRPVQWKPQVAAEEWGRFPDVNHKANFVECIRSRQQPAADVEEGHRTATLIHLANISYRLAGPKLEFDSSSETITNHADANRYLRREDARAPYAIPDTV
jgi:predicted dehydrogenase